MMQHMLIITHVVTISLSDLNHASESLSMAHIAEQSHVNFEPDRSSGMELISTEKFDCKSLPK
jgi:hypothetical protein